MLLDALAILITVAYIVLIGTVLVIAWRIIAGLTILVATICLIGWAGDRAMKVYNDCKARINNRQD